MNRRRRTVIVIWLAAASGAWADNAALTTGGLPRMMTAHPTIAMTSEVVRLVVHGKSVETDCTFVFTNSGDACTVNMGFPDIGMWAYDSPRDKPETFFTKFQSFVDGKRVPTKLVLGGDKREQWQTKMVSFAKHGKRVVREVYSTEVGGISQRPVVGASAYVLHTGASWNGGIGKATITVTYAPETEVATPLDIKYFPKKSEMVEGLMKHVSRPGGLIVFGPSKPLVYGATLTFKRSNWKPTLDDDILILYKYPTKVLAESSKEYDKRAAKHD